MLPTTIRALIRSAIVLGTLAFSVLVPFNRASFAHGCVGEPLRLTLTKTALQDIQFRWSIVDESMRVARGLRWEVPTAEQKEGAFTNLDLAEALVASMSRPLILLNQSGDISAVLMTVLMESVREANAILGAALSRMSDDTSGQKIALKHKLEEAAGDLLDLDASLVAGYRSAARGNVYQVERQATIPRRITLLGPQPASVTFEAPVGGAVRVDVTCDDESGTPVQVSARVRNLFGNGGDAPMSVTQLNARAVTIQSSVISGRATMYAVDIQVVEPVETRSLNPCLVLVTQDRLLSAPPDPIDPHTNRQLMELLALQTQQLTALRDQAIQLLADPQSQGSEDAISDVLASQVSRVNDFSLINALSRIGKTDPELRQKLDSLAEISESLAMRMQMMMDRRAGFVSGLSNALQRIGATQGQIVSALK
jgi:hypothetical protein